MVTNAQRCSAMVIFSRTSDAAGGRSHTQLFVEKDVLPPGALRYLPRFPSSGMRGVQLGGIELDRCPVDAGVALGPLGSAMEVALRSFQLTRTGLPAMTLGVLDTGLRAVLRFGEDRWLRGRPVGAMPVVRTALAEAFTDLLIADCLSTTVARAVHLLPEDTNAYASAVKYVVSGRSIRAMTRLGELLGAQSYLRTGEYGIFQKLQRDLAPAGFGHAARVACLATVLPQLPGWPGAPGRPARSHRPPCTTWTPISRPCRSTGCGSPRRPTRSRRSCSPPPRRCRPATSGCADWSGASPPSWPGCVRRRSASARRTWRSAATRRPST
ncbi:acyl-CoA dehydrogenase family protein [Micromonospora sp. BRA006-A]|nr:acyl-CoA dehydrogenase family protein [Micromonospora sp. BRA006-A]